MSQYPQFVYYCGGGKKDPPTSYSPVSTSRVKNLITLTRLGNNLSHAIKF